ncbi:MAG: hypothetical protein RR286_07945, partial [Mucinivorans sp.]
NASFTGALRTRSNQQIPYSVSFPYEPWMADLSLRLECGLAYCCVQNNLYGLSLITSKPIRYDVVLEPIKPLPIELSAIEKLDVELPFLYPVKDYASFQEDVDVLRAEGALLIHFRQGSVDVDPSFGDNQKTLDKITEILHLIAIDSLSTLEKVVLAGASSPEGTSQKNDILAQKRADALQDYLGVNISTRANLFEVVNVGEDWTGLRQMVAASNMEYKDLVLKTIDQYTVKQGREVELMKLKWGRPYNYMMEHFFPKLRSAGYIRLFYERKPSMELNETNQAIELYNQRSYADVLTRLENVKPTAVSEGMRGACYMMLGQYDKAEATLKNAITLGSRDAATQLEHLQKLLLVKNSK